MKIDIWRSRWAAAGAAVALTLGGGGLFAASALGSTSDASLLVPVVPLRVLDTRDAASPFHTMGPGGVLTLSLVDDVPADATAASINLTVVNGSHSSFLTLFPTGTEKPVASAINWADNMAHANSTVVKLGTAKSFDIYNLAGNVDVVVDLIGYYIPAPAGGGTGTGPQGPAGPQGPKGDKGDTGAPGADGTNGTNGVDGTNGTNGVDGAKGDKGDTGAPGADGTNGIDGTNGVDGTNGIDGTNGTNGIDGTNGVDGAKGDKGDTGAPGTNGIDGINGTNGTNGTNGVNGVSGYEVVTSAAVSANTGSAVTQKAVCPAGKQAINGGWTETTGNGILILAIGPGTTTTANDSWSITAKRVQSAATFTVTAICILAA